MFDHSWSQFLKIKVAPRAILKFLLGDCDIELVAQEKTIGEVGAGSVSTLGKFREISVDSCRFSVGRFCQFNGSSIVVMGGEHRTSDHLNNTFSDNPFIKLELNKLNNSNSAVSSKGHCVVGNGVILGTNAIVISGARIGDGCIVGAAAVCVKEYAPYSVLGGVPASVLYTRPQSARDKPGVSPYWDLKQSAIYNVASGNGNKNDARSLRRSPAKVVLEVEIADGKIKNGVVKGLRIKTEFFPLAKCSKAVQMVFRQLENPSEEITVTNDFDELLYQEAVTLQG